MNKREYAKLKKWTDTLTDDPTVNMPDELYINGIKYRKLEE